MIDYAVLSINKRYKRNEQKVASSSFQRKPTSESFRTTEV